LATIGVEQHTFRTTVMGCAGGCDPLGFQKKPSLGTCMATKISKKTIIGRLGWRRLGLSNTLFALLCSCVCGWMWCHRGWAAAVRRKQPLSSGNFTNGGGPGGGGSSQATALQRELYERRRPRRRRLVSSNPHTKLTALGFVVWGADIAPSGGRHSTPRGPT
jgi:hypothetical protein